MEGYKVEDLTTKAPASDVLAIVHYEKLGGYVEVHKDGSVRLISPAGTVSAKFRELEKRDLLRQSYIQALLEGGVTGEELQQALEAVARVDKRLAEARDRHQAIADLERRTDLLLRDWAAKRGIDYDALTDDEWMELVKEGIQAV
ncbi:MAG TPA: hypothetical protein EYP55_00700 [Anaerolineae bacterium]|nr:hypothetical protein [Anaerolineae bacterium]